MKPAQGSGTLCGTIVEINNDGLAKSIFPIKIGGTIGD
jgi:hypothetical protein